MARDPLDMQESNRPGSRKDPRHEGITRLSRTC